MADSKHSTAIVWPPQGVKPAGFEGISSDLVLFAVGDIHGRFDLLENLLEQIDRDIAELPPAVQAKVIFLGDYIDRGAQSKEVIERLIDLQTKHANWVFLRGNHEQAALDFVNAKQSGIAWLSFGGVETCRSYGAKVALADMMGRGRSNMRADLRNQMPSAHMSFLQQTKLMHTVGDYLFVHAGIRPLIDLEEQTAEDLLWIRRPFLKSKKWHGKLVIHGHSINESVQVLQNRIGIDTGAYATGVLTALKIEKGGLTLIQTSVSALSSASS